MARVKVKHALFIYTEERDGRTYTETALRGKTIDLDDEQAEAAIEKGAVIADDENLPRAGHMPSLSGGASSEEVLNWVLAATEDEVRELVAQRPDLEDQLMGAREIAERRELEQAKMLGSIIEENSSDPAQLPDGDNPPAAQGSTPDALTGASGDTAGDSTGDPSGDVGGEGDTAFTEEAADEVVSGNVSKVSAHLSENPQHGQAILDAESRLATKEDREVRQGVVRAVKASAEHNTQ